MASPLAVSEVDYSAGVYNPSRRVCEAGDEKSFSLPIPNTFRDFYFCALPEKKLEPPFKGKQISLFAEILTGLAGGLAGCTREENSNWDGSGIENNRQDAGSGREVVQDAGPLCMTRIGGEDLTCDGDIDGDGLLNQDDRCPLDHGSVDTGGCPDRNSLTVSEDAGQSGSMEDGGNVPDAGAFDAGNRDGGEETVRPPYFIERLTVGFDGAEVLGDSYSPSISSSGRFVVFSSNAPNLVENDTNGFSDIFLFDRETHQLGRVSTGLGGVEANEEANMGTGLCQKIILVSGNGKVVVFNSFASNLVPQETISGGSKIYAYDRETQSTELILDSHMASATGISEDGKFVAYTDYDYVTGQSGVYVYNRLTRERRRVDDNRLFGTEISWDSSSPTLSGDGQKVAFVTQAYQLPWVPGSNYSYANVFFRDMTTSTIDPISVNATRTGLASGANSCPVISAGGDVIAFQSYASDIVDGVWGGLFVFDKNLDSMEAILSSEGGPLRGLVHPSISGDGRFVAYGDSYREHLAVFVHDRTRDDTQIVSVGPNNGFEPNGDSFFPSISDDGHYVAFTSNASNLVVNNLGGRFNIFVVGLDYFFQQ